MKDIEPRQQPVPRRDLALRLQMAAILWHHYSINKETHSSLKFDEYCLVKKVFDLSLQIELGLLPQEEKYNAQIFEGSNLTPQKIAHIGGIGNRLADEVMGKRDIRYANAKREINNIKSKRLSAHPGAITSVRTTVDPDRINIFQKKTVED